METCCYTVTAAATDSRKSSLLAHTGCAAATAADLSLKLACCIQAGRHDMHSAVWVIQAF